MSGRFIPAKRQTIKKEVEIVKPVITEKPSITETKNTDPMKAVIPRITYITTNNPAGVYTFLKKEGIPVRPSFEGTLKSARAYVRHQGDKGFFKLVSAAHPDKRLLLNATGHDESGMCGSSSFNGERTGRRVAQQIAPEEMTEDQIRRHIDGLEDRVKREEEFLRRANLTRATAEKHGKALEHQKRLLEKAKEILAGLKAKGLGLLNGMTDQKKSEMYKWIAVIAVFIIVLLLVARKRKVVA